VQGRLRAIELAAAMAAVAPLARTHGLGTSVFPASGDTTAQAKFLEGIKALHSVQFDEAALASREALAIGGDITLPYWGEAMSYNHPFWASEFLWRELIHFSGEGSS
jgi:hypothetical protein